MYWWNFRICFDDSTPCFQEAGKIVRSRKVHADLLVSPLNMKNRLLSKYTIHIKLLLFNYITYRQYIHCGFVFVNIYLNLCILLLYHSSNIFLTMRKERKSSTVTPLLTVLLTDFLQLSQWYFIEKETSKSDKIWFMNVLDQTKFIRERPSLYILCLVVQKTDDLLTESYCVAVFIACPDFKL